MYYLLKGKMNIKELIRSENVDFTGMELSSECKADSVKVREETKKMPPVLQRYCEYIGIEGMPKYKAIRAYFKDTDFIFDDKSGKVLKMNYDLRLFYDTWYRIVFCQSSMYGVPFEGSDYCTEEREGGMKGCLGKWCQYLMCVQNRGIRQVKNCVQNRKKNACSFF